MQCQLANYEFSTENYIIDQFQVAHDSQCRSHNAVNNRASYIPICRGVPVRLIYQSAVGSTDSLRITLTLGTPQASRQEQIAPFEKKRPAEGQRQGFDLTSSLIIPVNKSA